MLGERKQNMMLENFCCFYEPYYFPNGTRQGEAAKWVTRVMATRHSGSLVLYEQTKRSIYAGFFSGQTNSRMKSHS
jgi:hypothetical protein